MITRNEIDSIECKCEEDEYTLRELVFMILYEIADIEKMLNKVE